MIVGVGQDRLGSAHLARPIGLAIGVHGVVEGGLLVIRGWVGLLRPQLLVGRLGLVDGLAVGLLAGSGVGGGVLVGVVLVVSLVLVLGLLVLVLLDCCCCWIAASCWAFSRSAWACRDRCLCHCLQVFL